MTTATIVSTDGTDIAATQTAIATLGVTGDKLYTYVIGNTVYIGKSV